MKEQLKLFQSKANRRMEEQFAQTLSENESVRLFFINENQAFTDGKNIVVDPAEDELFADNAALKNIASFLKLPPYVLATTWNVLKIVTRAQSIHESLHIVYSTFPPLPTNDPEYRTKNERLVASLIGNIIEDAYIEAVGCSVFDNMEFYLKFGRVSRLFANHPGEGTVSVALKQIRGKSLPESSEPTKGEILISYLDFMATMLLYPMVELPQPPKLFACYVDQTKEDYFSGSIAPCPQERYQYTKRIFSVIRELIPDDNEESLDITPLSDIIGGMKTHDVVGDSIGGHQGAGKSQEVYTRLFTDLNGEKKNDQEEWNGKLVTLVRGFSKDLSITTETVEMEGKVQVFTGTNVGASFLHDGITIREFRPAVDYQMARAYQNIRNQYAMTIRNYQNRFSMILKGKIQMREERLPIGTGISSKYLSDVKKRYWYKIINTEDVPEISILLLVDGSGSMAGARRNSAMTTAVIMHEVLSKHGIAHAVAEHRAKYNEPEINVNILLGFDEKKNEQYNLLHMGAGNNSRDGLALLWAGKYIQKMSSAESKIVVVLSDGLPEHAVDGYYPPKSTRDTAEVVRKLKRQGVHVIAIALDDEEEEDCYTDLKEIYPDLIECEDMAMLPGQMLTLITRLLR